MLVERAFGRIVGRKLREYQKAHNLSDQTTGRLGRVTQSYWWRVRRGLDAPDAEAGASTVGERLISGLAVSMPDLLREAIDEVQELKATEVARLHSSGRSVPAELVGASS